MLECGWQNRLRPWSVLALAASSVQLAAPPAPFAVSRWRAWRAGHARPARPLQVRARASTSGQEGRSKREALHQRCSLSWHDFLCRLSHGEMDSFFVLCGATAGNLGAILRSCTLLGISAVCIVGGPSRALLDKAFRFSMVEQRSHWEVAVVPVPADVNASCAMAALKSAGTRLVGLVAKDATEKPTFDLWELDLGQNRLAFVFGSDNEDGEAFAEGVEQSLDMLATVPTRQFPLRTHELAKLAKPEPVDTLNLSVTASIVAYERRRQLSTWRAKLREWTRKMWSAGKREV